jgi:hypothetical protein
VFLIQIKYEQECNRCELLQARLVDLEQDLVNRKQQSKILGQLQIDVKRLHSAFHALEVCLHNKRHIYSFSFTFYFIQVENTQLNTQLSLIRQNSLPIQD